MAKPKSIHDLTQAYQAAYGDLRDALARAYPIGSQWLVRINSRQTHPSLMTVIAIEAGWQPCIRFEMPGRPRRFGYGEARTYRCTVPLSRIERVP